MIWKLRIFGEPRPVPRKTIGRPGGTKRASLYYQCKTEAERSKISWMERVQMEALAVRPDEMIPLGVPIAVYGSIYLTRPKSNKSKIPGVKPDTGRIVEVIEDQLQGIVYANDSQIADHGKWRRRWANVSPNDDEDPGISIVVEVMR